jgi:hypothetical protein
MAMDETHFVTQIHPVELTGVRDSGVAALMLLAASMGWNILQKQHQPAKLTARDGTQRRLATDSSCKMSVFQTTLSTIMVHSDYGDIHPVATIELIDRIIAETKVDREHARRLRLAVGETPAEHRQRIANDKAAEQRREPEEHLTQHIADAWLDAPVNSTSIIDEEGELQTYVPFDGEEHGMLVSRQPFQGHYSGGGDHEKAYYYESVTSFERIWEDGYIDYECQVCGMVKRTPRAVASHRQVHTKSGEVERDERYYTAEYRAHREKRLAATKAVEFVDELPLEEQVNERLAEVAEAMVQPRYTGLDDASILGQIIDLILPEVQRNYDTLVAALVEQRDAAEKKLAEVEAEFDALVDLLTSRKQGKGNQ